MLRDAAVACGESIGTVASSSVGPAFARHRGPASRVLEALVPRGWYVDEAGVTQIGSRAAVAWTGAATRITNDEAQRRYELAPSTLVGLLPGAIVDGVEALDVEHVLDGEGKLRTTLWGGPVAPSARLPEALRRIVEHYTAQHRYRGVWEYRVVLQTGQRLDLQAVRASSGMPDLRGVRVRPSAGCRASLTLGSIVLVAFVNGDPTRPFLTAFEGPSGGGWLPISTGLDASTNVNLGGATGRALRSGDMVNIPGVMPGPGVTGVLVTLAPAVLVAPGPPGVGYSKVLE